MNRAVRAIFNKAVDARSVDYFESPHNFCESPLLQQYLTQKEYALHPCDAYRQSLAVQKLCEVFSVTVQPAYEVQGCVFVHLPCVAFFYLFGDSFFCRSSKSTHFRSTLWELQLCRTLCITFFKATLLDFSPSGDR